MLKRYSLGACAASVALLLGSAALAAAGPDGAPSTKGMTPGRFFVAVVATSVCRLQPTPALAASLGAHPVVQQLGDAFEKGTTPAPEQIPCDAISKLPGARALKP